MLLTTVFDANRTPILMNGYAIMWLLKVMGFTCFLCCGVGSFVGQGLFYAVEMWLLRRIPSYRRYQLAKRRRAKLDADLYAFELQRLRLESVREKSNAD